MDVDQAEVTEQNDGIEAEKEDCGEFVQTPVGPKLLLKNSVIQVTVDDLSEGLIVVSFTHEDNLYQGVLLQLNRERGIPCGISFPKDYFTGALESREEVDPAQIPPLNLRHSYFQNAENIGLNVRAGFKSGHGLRRVIKPPARFKNVKSSVRLRARPVLCAKCNNICEEKAPGTDTVGKGIPTAESQEKIKKRAIASTADGVTTRRGKSSMGITCSKPLNAKDNEANQDYSYVSVGSKDFIENYWKRPSLKPPLDELPKLEFCGPVQNVKSIESKPNTLNSSGKEKLSNGVTGAKCLGRIQKDKLANTQSNASHLQVSVAKGPTSTLVPKLIVKSCPPASVTAKTGKAKKSKLVKKFGNKRIPTVRIVSVSQSNKEENPDPHGEKYGEKQIEKLTCIIPKIVEPSVSQSSAIANNNQGSAESRTKEKCIVPIRLREDKEKRTFSFRKCKSDETANTDISKDLDSGIRDGENVSSKKRPKSLPLPLFLAKTNCSSVEPSAPTVASQPLDSETVSSNSEAKPEPAKTPVIKICVGTLTVKIPPKVKQEDSSVEERAKRRAMKKAKKDARRKLSSLQETAPLGESGSPVSPKQGAGDLEVFPTCDISALVNTSGSTSQESGEFTHISKKKKKDKKRKKRASQENGGSAATAEAESPPLILSEQEEASLAIAIANSAKSGFSLNPSNNETQDCVRATALLPKIVSHEDSKSASPSSARPNKRLCLSLRRMPASSSSSWDITDQTISLNEEQGSDTAAQEAGSELNDFPVNQSPSHEVHHMNGSSVDAYKDQTRDYLYKKGHIVWGKLPGCPWWPGKILDISVVDSGDVTAQVAWYRASTLSSVKFSHLGPFEEEFDARYVRSRRRGAYQYAVRDALIESHQLDPSDLPSD